MPEFTRAEMIALLGAEDFIDSYQGIASAIPF
jgi:hypothetical protein